MNYIFTFIFVCEAIIRISVAPIAYFSEGWNLFDFFIAFGSVIGILISTNTSV